MAKAGEVRLRLSAAEARLLSSWLVEHYAPTSSRDAPLAISISAMLSRKATRRRSAPRIEIAMRRDIAAWFSKLPLLGFTDATGEMVCSVPSEIYALRDSFTVALRGRGMPLLSRESRRRRLSGTFAVSNRQRQRVRLQNEIETEFENWIERGNTILGGPEPLPRKLT